MNFNHPEVECYKPEYYYFAYYFIIPQILIWFLIYVVIILALTTKKLKLKKAKTIILFGFLFLGYNSHAYLWEFAKIVLRIGISVFNELLLEEIRIKEILISIIFLTYCLVFWQLQPYGKMKIYNYLD